MRSVVGTAMEDDFDDTPPPAKRKARTARAKGAKGARPKRGREKPFVARWADSFRSTMRRLMFWGAVLLFFFAVVAVMGLFSGGHVQAAMRSTVASFDAMMVDNGLTVQSVTLEGRNETTPGEIGRMLGIKRGTPMLYVDVDEARARLEALPWVKSAQVRRVWPDRISIYIVERKPVALWQNEGDVVVVDIDGHPIPGEDVARFSALPLLVGKGAETAAASLMALIATQPNLKSRVKAAVRVGERRWNLRLDNGVEVRLPEEGAEAALGELVRLDREQEILARDIKAIDLRFPDRFIVKLPPGSPLVAPAPRPNGGRET
ncbi:MAG: cell division protein FtsQ/DivIB [Alphaproteobacteria bacterium]|nr:cell division protein FtsQ/DivIB [Alphaproteobacteria bacterium]